MKKKAATKKAPSKNPTPKDDPKIMEFEPVNNPLLGVDPPKEEDGENPTPDPDPKLKDDPQPKKEATKKKPKDPPPADEDNPEHEPKSKPGDDEFLDIGDFEPIENKDDAEPKDDPDPEDVEPDDISDKKEKNDRLRTELKNANNRAKQAEEEKAELQKEIEKLRSESESKGKQLTELEKRVSYKDPSQHPEVVSIYDRFNGDLASEIETMNFSSDDNAGDRLNSEISNLVGLYNGIGDPSSEGYQNRAEAFKEKLRTDYPGEERRVFEIVKKGSVAVKTANDKMGEISANGSKYEYEEARKQFDYSRDRYRELTKDAFSPSKELAETDPYHPSVIFDTLLKAEESEGNSEFAADVKKAQAFAEFVSNPLAPLSPEDIAKIPEDQREEKLAARQKNWQQSVERAQSVAPLAMMSLRLLPKLFSENLEMKKELENYRETKPRISSESEETPIDDGEEIEPADIRNFTPSNPVLDKK